jgi:hypothetical protein
MPITTLHNYLESGENIEFDSRYKDNVFLLWYSSGKPTVARLRGIISDELGVDPTTKRIPFVNTLATWVDSDFKERAEALDQEVERQMQEQVVKQKVEMLQRHAQIAKTMQAQAVKYLTEHDLGNARNAITALTEGLRLERESVGVIPYFDKISDLSDDALMTELKRLVSKTPVSFGQVSNDEEDS